MLRVLENVGYLVSEGNRDQLPTGDFDSSAGTPPGAPNNRSAGASQLVLRYRAVPYRTVAVEVLVVGFAIGTDEGVGAVGEDGADHRGRHGMVEMMADLVGRHERRPPIRRAALLRYVDAYRAAVLPVQTLARNLRRIDSAIGSGFICPSASRRPIPMAPWTRSTARIASSAAGRRRRLHPASGPPDRHRGAAELRAARGRRPELQAGAPADPSAARAARNLRIPTPLTNPAAAVDLRGSGMQCTANVTFRTRS